MSFCSLLFFFYLFYISTPLGELCFVQGETITGNSNKAEQCQDKTIEKGTFWTDRMDFPCKLYEGAEWCTHDGEKGPGWDQFWGNFIGFVSHGMTCKDACCGCGGGNKDPNTFDDTLPIYDGVPAYPYDEVDYHFTAEDQNTQHCHKCVEGNIWNDSWGYSCLAYHYGDFCTTEGETGPGWSPTYGPIASYRNAKRDAFGACGACGF